MVLSCLCALNIFGCGSEDSSTLSDPTADILAQISPAQWEILAQKRIYFAHQSVGLDILNGIDDLSREYPDIHINIVNHDEPPPPGGGYLSHSYIGENCNPRGKIDAFASILASETAATLDVAALKFCFLDVTAETDLDLLLESYADVVDRLREAHPDLVFVHVTVPVTTSTQTWRRMLKRLLRGVNQKRDNIARDDYNAALRQRYSGREPIFDLARIQSTYPDGSRCTCKVDGRSGHALIPQYSRDGYHLNQLGRRVVAAQLLVLLVHLWDDAPLMESSSERSHDG